MYHTIDICQDIAEKLKNPSSVNDHLTDRVNNGIMGSSTWPNITLTAGIPGIVCFYATMDHLFPDQKWDKVAHQYLKLAVNFCENKGYNGYSLFQGLGGLCFAAYMCSKRGTRYQQLLRKLEAILIQEVENDLTNLRNNELKNGNYIAPYRYNLMFGLTGIIAYLLLRKDDARLLKLAKECIAVLINLLKTPKNIGSASVPGWYVANEFLAGDFEKEKYPNGSFVLTLPYGVTGCLSVLSLAAWEGIDSPQLYETIKLIASWLRKKQSTTPTEASWPIYTSFEMEIEENPVIPNQNPNGWCYGVPAVASSLCLAGRVLRDKSLKTYSEDAFTNFFAKTWQEDKSVDPSFAFGKAGLLAVTYRMAKLTDSGQLMKRAASLEQNLKNLYSPTHPFGFQSINHLPTNETQWLNEPGILDGATGIALSLLLAQGRTDDVLWDRAFLIA